MERDEKLVPALQELVPFRGSSAWAAVQMLGESIGAIKMWNLLEDLADPWVDRASPGPGLLNKRPSGSQTSGH